MSDDYENPSEEQIAAFENQLDDLSEKDLLIGILAELKWLRVALTHDARGERDTATVYECNTCGKRVPEHDRERHAKEQHNLPPGMDYSEEYREVEA